MIPNASYYKAVLDFCFNNKQIKDAISHRERSQSQPTVLLCEEVVISFEGYSTPQDISFRVFFKYRNGIDNQASLNEDFIINLSLNLQSGQLTFANPPILSL